MKFGARSIFSTEGYIMILFSFLFFPGAQEVEDKFLTTKEFCFLNLKVGTRVRGLARGQ